MVDASLELWAVKTVCQKTTLSRPTIYQMVREGKFPQPRKISPSRSAWWSTEVIAWIAALPKAGEAMAA